MVTDWPCDTGGTADAYPANDLFRVIRQALLNAPVATAQALIAKAVHCARTHQADEGGNATKHCEYVHAARAAALIADWPACEKALDHNGATGGAVGVPPATSWPCDPGTATNPPFDPDEHLFNVIELANTTAPPVDWADVILTATTCALEHQAEYGSGYGDASAHATYVMEAVGYANTANWSSCIEALEHQSGGSDDGSLIGSMHELPPEERMRRILERMQNLRDAAGRGPASPADELIELMRDLARIEVLIASGEWPPKGAHEKG